MEKTMTSAERERLKERVLAEALDQYVSNTEEALDLADDSATAVLARAGLTNMGITREKLALAQEMLDKLNAKQAALAV